MRVVNTDDLSHQKKLSEKCLLMVEKKKGGNYLEYYHLQRRQFSPFFVSVEGLLGVEAEYTLKHTAIRLTTKWKQTYSRTCGSVKSRAAITLVRATQLCIWGLPGAIRQDWCSETTMVGRCRYPPLPVINMEKEKLAKTLF